MRVVHDRAVLLLKVRLCRRLSLAAPVGTPGRQQREAERDAQTDAAKVDQVSFHN
jgi:hypothetical protein